MKKVVLICLLLMQCLVASADTQLQETLVTIADAQLEETLVSSADTQLQETLVTIADAQLEETLVSSDDTQLQETLVTIADTQLEETLVTSADTQLQETLAEERPHPYEVFTPCSTSSTFKSYMDYRTITNKSSQQYKLQQSAFTENGYRIFDSRIMIAVVGFSVGDKLDLYLESGEVLETVVGDIKANTSCEHPDGSIVEFIVDTKTMPNDIKLLGNYNSIHEGSVLKIHKIKEVVE